jgi:hypothetical protein
MASLRPASCTYNRQRSISVSASCSSPASENPDALCTHSYSSCLSCARTDAAASPKADPPSKRRVQLSGSCKSPDTSAPESAIGGKQTGVRTITQAATQLLTLAKLIAVHALLVRDGAGILHCIDPWQGELHPSLDATLSIIGAQKAPPYKKVRSNNGPQALAAPFRPWACLVEGVHCF